MFNKYNGFPTQLLSFKSKTKAWRTQCVDYGSDKATISYNPVRKSVMRKKINYDLVNGILHMLDLELILNPENLDAGFIPDNIPHYPIMNSKLNVLKGEEDKRIFDYRVKVTNPNAISEIEELKKLLIQTLLLQLILESSQSEEEFNLKLLKMGHYFLYEYQDIRELRANCLINHYKDEYDFTSIFNEGFSDASIVGEEIYLCDIIGGEPTLERLNPMKVRVFRSGYSNRIEDADMIVIEDYWSPGRVIDTYYEWLSPKDIKYIETLPDSDSASDSMDNIDERLGFINRTLVSDVFEEGDYNVDTTNLFTTDTFNSLLPYDLEGNIRVCKVYWKSKRKIKEIKSYDLLTGLVIYDFYNEDYVCDESLGEEEKIFWINEAWEGIKIGEDIYVNMRPRPIQYNRLNNPSRCHFGIIGTIYNINESKPFSLVDMMKKYNYLYDVIHDRLNKAIANNWGAMLDLDLSKVPKGWDIDKWLYYAKVNHLRISDSFNEGRYGAATGKLAGGMNNASSGGLVLDLGNFILQLINLLEFIKMEMSEVAGISKLREGLISNRETVGGVERATLLSSHITEWIFSLHDNLKRRVLNCFLETCKIALKGRNKKFQYILPSTGLTLFIDIDGDEFAENDYGLVVDNSNSTLELNSKLDMLAQAALLNLTLSFSTIAKLYSSCSLAEKLRFIENDELLRLERAQLALQQEMQVKLQEIEARSQMELLKLLQLDMLNLRDNETRILVAEINSEAEALRFAMMNDDDGVEEPVYTQEAKDRLLELIREFDARLRLDKDKLALEKSKAQSDKELKLKLINKSKTVNK